jgi:signal transduction histidine kinase
MSAHLGTALREPKHLPKEQVEWTEDQIEGQLDEVKRLAKIVDSLTLLTKADARLVQLAELVEEAFEDAQVLARPHGVLVVLGDCTGNLMTGDRHRLRQLLLILTDNAVEYNVPGGGIEISLRHVDRMAKLKITNTGEGIAQEMIDHVFDRFTRGKNAQSKTEGCGLGLTFAQWIVLAHGGTIRLLDEGGGKTTALVRLPAEAGETRSGIRCRVVPLLAESDVGL